MNTPENTSTKPASAFDNTTIVWIVLVATTLFSWWVGGGTMSSAELGSVMVLAVAIFKVRLVGIHFMELGDAPLIPLRLIFEAWILIVGIGLIVAYLWQ